LTDPFVPPGHVFLQAALILAARAWYPEQAAIFDLEWNRAPEHSQARTLAEAEMKPLVEDASNRLRTSLYQGIIVAFYSSPFGSGLLPIKQAFWGSRAADGVIERGEYEPFGPASTPSNKRYAEPVFIEERALAQLLGNKGNNETPGVETRETAAPKRRVSGQAKACQAAFMALYGGEAPSEEHKSNTQLCREVSRYIAETFREHRGIGDYAILVAAGRKPRKQRRPKQA
jgi:hypothetical protein